MAFSKKRTADDFLAGWLESPGWLRRDGAVEPPPSTPKTRPRQGRLRQSEENPTIAFLGGDPHFPIDTVLLNKTASENSDLVEFATAIMTIFETKLPGSLEENNKFMFALASESMQRYRSGLVQLVEKSVKSALNKATKKRQRNATGRR